MLALRVVFESSQSGFVIRNYRKIGSGKGAHNLSDNTDKGSQ